MEKRAIYHKGHCRVSLSAIFLLPVLYKIKKQLSYLIITKKAEDPRQKPSGMTPLFYKGFTLIELLVVVLIIGILAAIALPQYQAAVLKSRYTELMTNVKSIVNELEIYYLANGEYPNNDVSSLGVEISGCSVRGDCFECDDATYDYYDGSSYVVGGFLKNYIGLAYLQWPTHDATKAGTRECWADLDNTTANQVCRSLGGVVNGANVWRSGNPYTHSKKVWRTYALP